MIVAAAMTLGALVSACAPAVAPRTALAIIAVESGGRPWAVHDNTAGRGMTFGTRDDAEAYARRRISAGASVDLGLTQINSANLPGLGLAVERVFEPCTNVAYGMRILRGAYARAVARYGPGPVALFHAFEAYNAGGLDGAPHYASTVWSTAREIVLGPESGN